MKNRTSAANAVHILKFILFSLIFIGIGAMVCLLWSFIGRSAEAGLNENYTALQRPTVIIDAGHGGADGGAVGLSDTPEKNLNLDIALTLRDILATAGIDVVMTRTEDTMLHDPQNPSASNKSQDLSARRRIAESYDNAVFVSIHMNSFPTERYRGLQVFYSPNNESGKNLAAIVQSSVASFLQPDNGRAIKAADDSIYLLDNLSCPAVLIECGFLTNADEAGLLNNPEYRRRLAFVIGFAVTEFIYRKAS